MIQIAFGPEEKGGLLSTRTGAHAEEKTLTGGGNTRREVQGLRTTRRSVFGGN